LVIEVREVVLACPVADLVLVAVRPAVAVGTIAVVVLLELLVLALQVLLEDDATDLKVPMLVSPAGFLLAVRRVEIRIVVDLAGATDARVERLQRPVVPLQGVRSEQVPARFRECETALVVPKIDGLNEPLVSEMMDCARVHFELLFGHYSENPDGGERAAVIAIQLDACEQGCVVRAAEATGQELSGTRIVTERPAGKTGDDDVFDIGFVRLSGSEVAGIGADNFLDLTYTVDGLPAEPVEAMIALGFAARDQAVERGVVRTKLTMFMTGPESSHAYRLARTDSRSHLLVRYERNEMVFNGQHHGSAPSLKGMSGGGLWQVSLSGAIQPAQPPALAAMIIEQPDPTARPSLRPARR
jgi:hypothetical protein